MSDKIIFGHCWKSFQYNNSNHVNNLNDWGVKALEIYINLADFPQATPDQEYMKKIFNMQDGMWCWDDFSQRWWSANPNDKVKDAFTYCKNNNVLPIVCFGHNEEQTSWIGRSPSEDKMVWLELMATEFAEYLKINYNFARADIVSWNEANECQSASVHANVTYHLAKGWKTVYPNSWMHGFNSNIKEQNFLNDCLGIPLFVSSVDAISFHILTDAEWDTNLIAGAYNKVTASGLNVTWLEVSPLGDMARLNKLLGKGEIVCCVLLIRNSLIGQGDGITITDLLIYDFDNPNSFISVNSEKIEWLKTWTAVNTKPVETEVPVGPVYISNADWTLVNQICNSNAQEPYLIAAIGWHETHWGRVGAGPGGWHLGYGYYGDPVVAAKYKGLENQLKGAHSMILPNFNYPVTLQSVTDFAVNHWKSSVPTAWATSVYKQFAAITNTVPTSPYNADTQLTTNFKYGEFFCRGEKPPDKYFNNILELAQQLQILRDISKGPIRIESGWRTLQVNTSLGGAANSQHLIGKAADVVVVKVPNNEVGYYAARYCPKINGIGFGKVRTTHLDTRNLFTPYSY